uniref:Uncharacterized protein n=1 Tax=Anguilla anguilla TaxID=7936 RepID=A0A0E9TAV7_ANGAN
MFRIFTSPGWTFINQLAEALWEDPHLHKFSIVVFSFMERCVYFSNKMFFHSFLFQLQFSE